MFRTSIAILIVSLGAIGAEFEGAGSAPETPNLAKISADKKVDKISSGDRYFPQLEMGKKKVKLPNIQLKGNGGAITLRIPIDNTSNRLVDVYPFRGTPNGSKPFNGQMYTAERFLDPKKKEDLPYLGNIGLLLLKRYPDSTATAKYFEKNFGVDLDAQTSSGGGVTNPLLDGGLGNHAGGFGGASGSPFGGATGTTYRDAIQDWASGSEEWSEMCEQGKECTATHPEKGELTISDALKALKKVAPAEAPQAVASSSGGGHANLTRVDSMPSLDSVLEKAKSEGNKFAVVMHTHPSAGVCPPCENMKNSTLPQLDAQEGTGVYVFSAAKSGWDLPTHPNNRVPYTEVYDVSGEKPVRVQEFGGFRSTGSIKVQ